MNNHFGEIVSYIDCGITMHGLVVERDSTNPYIYTENGSVVCAREYAPFTRTKVKNIDASCRGDVDENFYLYFPRKDEADAFIELVNRHFRWSGISPSAESWQHLQVTIHRSGGITIVPSSKGHQKHSNDFTKTLVARLITDVINHSNNSNPPTPMSAEQRHADCATTASPQKELLNAAMDVAENIRLRRKYNVVDVEGKLTAYGRELQAQLTFQGVAASKMAAAIDELLLDQEAA